jgi:hypothetical protein
LLPMLDERDEALEQAIHFIQESAERWHNRLTYKNLRLAKRYIEGKLEILLLVKEVDIGGKEWCALLHRIPLGRLETERHDGQVLCVLTDSAKYRSNVEGERPVGDADRDQKAMFIDRVEMVDQPDVLAVPTGVRLEGIQRLPELLRGTSYLSIYKGLQFPNRRDASLARDREYRLVSWDRDGGVGEIVKAGPDGVDRITQDQRYRNGNRVWPWTDLGGTLPRLRIILCDDVVWIAPVELADRRFEISDVLFRTVQFQPHMIEPARHEVTSSDGGRSCY